MDSSSFHRFSSLKIMSTLNSCNYSTRCSTSSFARRPSIAEANSAFSYKKFVKLALQETGKHTQLVPSPLQEDFSCLTAIDGKTELQMHSFQSPKIRLLRSLSIEGRSDGMQVLDFAIFPRMEFSLPIFCANFFTTAVMNIIVLDLNPLHDVINQREYKEKYYRHLISLGLKYAELLPWGGKITAESLKFFSPIVIWTKFPPSQDKQHILYSAFKDYLKSWLELMEAALPETDVSVNIELQHRYLTWRAEKDPGHQVLTRLIGETRAKEIIQNFLFNGVDELGSKTFTDYFPEYKCDDGTVNKRRSMIGKSFDIRPWDTKGEFIGNS
ncbi:Phytochromobilin\\x3aferredoxin oxidoreductase-chloroplastic [Striga hermonthica]|uniref:Phytochromobilin\x3aferredoxin oxidoreductase-chloroplastic n=1 Tax=Striga hermonthica TaxID=68872 RepID=A0A9N7NF18_STRHE|nr:Phytochromobilin\\x3aferredoxin oxidoreductase-chloroplastic [Striga hermonthica]